MREHTLQEFEANLARARSLVGVYELSRGAAAGRRSVSKTDVLRAAVVFLHSSLEEVVRNLYLWKLPAGSADKLDEIPFVGSRATHRPSGILLGKLAGYRGRIVDNIIRESIGAYVDQMNVNNIPELQKCLEMIGLNPQGFAARYPYLGQMMARRHQIVHQMDRNRVDGAGQHAAQSISVARVNQWVDNLNTFVRDVLASIPD